MGNYIPVAQAKEKLGMSRQFLYLQDKKNPGLLVKFGGRTLVDLKVFESMLVRKGGQND